MSSLTNTRLSYADEKERGEISRQWVELRCSASGMLPSTFIEGRAWQGVSRMKVIVFWRRKQGYGNNYEYNLNILI